MHWFNSFVCFIQRQWSVVVLILSGLIASFFCYFFVIRYANVVWDESLAQSWVYVVYLAIKNFDSNGAAYAFHTQVVYPPLFSFFYAIPTVVLQEFSVRGARTVNLIWFFASGLAVYMLGAAVDKVHGKRIGVIAALLLFSAPMFLVHAGIGLREIVSVFWSILTIYWYLKSYNHPVFSLFTSIGLVFLFGIKYQYELFLLVPMALEALIGIVTSKQKIRIIIQHLLIVLPFCLAAFWWIYFPSSKYWIILDIFYNRWNYTGGMAFWQYVRLVPDILIFDYSISASVGFFLLISLVYSLTVFRIRAVRVFWFAVIMNIMIALSHTNNMQERYFMLTVPFLYVLTGIMISREYPRIRMWFRRRAMRVPLIGALAIFLVFLGKDIVQLPRTVYALGSMGVKSPLFNQLDYNDAWFNFDRRTWPNRMPWESHESPDDVLNFIFENVDLSLITPIYGRPGELAPDLFNLHAMIRRAKKQYPSLPFSAMTVTIEVLRSSRYYTRDFKMLNAWRISEIRAVETDPSWKIYKKREFTELGMIVTIFGK